MTIIPAIDIIDGKCVRLTQGDYSQQTLYNEHPLEVAMKFQDAGLTRLHLVDLDGAREQRVKNWGVLERLAAKTELLIDFGGGINSDKDVQIAFDSGATWATVGSIAVKRPDDFTRWLKQFGATRFLLGADVRDRKIAIHGWTDTADIDIIDFINDYMAKGVEQIFSTDVSKDGKLEGPATSLYEEIIERCPAVKLIASGGISSIGDLEALAEFGCVGAIVGKAIYESRISLEEIKSFILSC